MTFPSELACFLRAVGLAIGIGWGAVAFAVLLYRAPLGEEPADLRRRLWL